MINVMIGRSEKKRKNFLRKVFEQRNKEAWIEF